MSVIGSSILAGASGAAGGDKVYVDDVFSTYVYDGNSSDQPINNGIDLAGEGGLVWIKKRDTSGSHSLTDTVTGIDKNLISNSTNAQATDAYRITAVSANGFTLHGDGTNVNTNGDDFVSWTFRKAPGWCDIVTWTGNSTARTISHQLGSVPGMIIVKVISGGTDDWFVYHRSLGDQRIKLNSTNASGSTAVWNYTAPTSSVFSVGTDGGVNGSGRTYIAYVFAHDDAQYGTGGNESIIKCGSYTGNGGSQSIDVGFEPQWVMVKNASGSSDWAIFDVMRNFGAKTVAGVGTANQTYLKPNSSAAESTDVRFNVTNTGFEITVEGAGVVNYSGSNYIYMAIRRPHKPPEAATEVFAIDTGNGSSTIPCFDSGFPVDFAFRRDNYASAGTNPRAQSRLQGARTLYPSQTNSEGSDSGGVWDSNEGWCKSEGSGSIAWMFKRAPGFFDVVTYTADGTNNQVKNHNLSVTPELMFVKIRSGSDNWSVYHKDLGATKYLKLNEDSSAVTAIGNWRNTAPTSTQFTIGGDPMVGGNTHTYVAYLFATLPGISKVGSYSGSSSALNIDCGFTNGARFVLIKRTDSSGHWYLWDTTRGYNGTTDNFLLLNSTGGQSANIANIDDHLDVLAAGFTVKASSGVNTSGADYIFLAIA